MTRIIMNGCNGKMGRCITEICRGDSEAKIVAGVDYYTEPENDYPVFSDIDDCDVEADVMIDFSSTQELDKRFAYCRKHQLPLVLCTTGLSEAQLLQAADLSTQIALLRSANMSLGINTLLALLKKAAAVFAPAGFDMEIVERHHNQKVDAPSGTALAMADAMNDALDHAYEYKYDRSGEREKRKQYENGISSLRGGNIVGEHEVIFAGQDEVIEFKHTAYSKAVFAKGAVEAAKFLRGKEPGSYDMADVIAAKQEGI